MCEVNVLDKKEALRIIYRCAKLYQENLEGKNLLFVSLHNKNRFEYIETKFLKGNYQHLTGVVVDETTISPAYFYEKCINRRLSINEFEFKSDGTTPLKLSVLEQMMDIHKNSKMIGVFNGTKPALYSDKIIGNIVACMGLVKDSQFYVPVTILREDIRDIIENQGRIVAIFSKSIHYKLYGYLLYNVKGMEANHAISNEIIEKIDFSNLIHNFRERPTIINEATDNVLNKSLEKVENDI